MHLTNNNIMVRIKWCFRIQVNWSRTKSQLVKNWLLTKLTFNIIIVCIPILFSSGLAFEMKNVWNCLLSPHHVASLCHWEIEGQELGKSFPLCVFSVETIQKNELESVSFNRSFISPDSLHSAFSSPLNVVVIPPKRIRFWLLAEQLWIFWLNFTNGKVPVCLWQNTRTFF